MTGEATDYPFKNPLKQDNNNIIASLICFLFKSVQATSRICWFSLFFFASSPPCFFLKFNSLISNPYPAITLPKPPGCYTEKYGRDTADKLIFLVSTGLCVCVCMCAGLCKLSLLNHTVIVYCHKMEESTTVTSSIFKNRRISKNTSRYCDSPLYRCSSEMFLSESVNSE